MELAMARVRDEHPPAGWRVLADRVWPRGVTKEQARVDLWAKDLAPSTELRRWYHEDADGRRERFVRRYREELDAAAIDEVLGQLSGHECVVLLTDGKDVDASQLPVLQAWLRERG